MKKTWLTGNSPYASSIHILDDDSLLNIFYLYRLDLISQNMDMDHAVHLSGGGRWVGKRWWYKFAHVCQKWRNLILGSASYLGLSLVCTYGTPVADMLAHSPRLPLSIDYFAPLSGNTDTFDINGKSDKFTVEDEENLILALKQRDRICRLRLRVPVPSLQKFLKTLDDEYPILEYLILALPSISDTVNATFRLPEALRAPRLRHLALIGFTLPIGCRLLTAAVDLVVLWLRMCNPSTYFRPNVLLQWISSMSRLETLVIEFLSSRHFPDAESQLTQTPIITRIALPNLLFFKFIGISTYLDTLAHWIIAPRLEGILLIFASQPTFSIPSLLEFMDTTENLKYDSANITLSGKVVLVKAYLHEQVDGQFAFFIGAECTPLDSHVSIIAQILSSLGQRLSAVEHLTLDYVEGFHGQSHDHRNVVNRTEWRRLLRSFCNLKTLRIESSVVEDLSRCLRLEDGEHPLELLPELQELAYSGSGDANSDAFSSFIDARQNAGRPVTLVSPGPKPNFLHLVFSTDNVLE